MGPFSHILLHLLCQILTGSSNEPIIAGNVSPDPTKTDLLLSASSSVRYPRDVTSEFSTPLVVTSTSRPLPLPKLSPSDLILDSNALSVSKNLNSKTPSVLLTSPILESVLPLPYSTNLNTFSTSECLSFIPKSTSIINDINPCTTDFKTVLSSNFRSNELPPSNLVLETFISTPKPSFINSNVISAAYNCESSSIPSLISNSNRQLSQSKGLSSFQPSSSVYSPEFILPRELFPSMSPFPFESTTLPNVVTPIMPMVSNYPDFLGSMSPYQNLNALTDPYLYDATISPIYSRSIPYLMPVTAENYLFKDLRISEPIFGDNFISIPSSVNTLEANNPCTFIPSSSLPEVSTIEPNIISNAMYPKPSIVELFSTISTIKPRMILPINVPECPDTIPMECLDAVSPPKVPLLLDIDSILGRIDPNLAQPKFSPRTNPGDYIKSICSTIKTEPTALYETCEILPGPIETSDLVDLFNSNILLNTLETVSTNPLPVTNNPINYIYNTPDPSFDSSSIPSYSTLNEAYVCYSTPASKSNDFPTSISLNLPDVVSPSIQSTPSIVVSPASSTITPNQVERLSKIIGSNSDTPTVYLSIKEPLASSQSTPLPSVFGSDIYCTKDSILFNSPSSSSVSFVKQTPLSPITAATSKVVSSINDAASKIAKNTMSSLSSYLKSMTQIKPKSRPPAIKTNSLSSKTCNPPSLNSMVYTKPVTSYITSDCSKLSNVPYSTPIPSSTSKTQTSSPYIPFKTYSLSPVSPTHLPSPVLPSCNSPSSPVQSTSNSKDIDTLIDLVLLSELLKDDDCIDQEALETILTLLCIN